MAKGVTNASGNPSIILGRYVRMLISPASLAANGTDCKIFLTNSSLQVESMVDGVLINSSGYEQKLQAA